MKKLLRRGMALGLVAGLVAVPASIPALAQNGEAASITHQQSVLTQLTATGELDSARVFTQLKVAGDGPVEVVLPNQSTRGLRNLEGLGRPSTDDDSIIFGIDATPDGVSERTVANHTADLPVSIEVVYELDGETLENPRDLVGRSGELEVTYKLRNETVEEQELEIFNARQEPTTEMVDVGVPLVGTLSLPLDNRFTNVRADDANLVGDGRGNTIVNWSLVLFEPLGFFEQEVSWTAQMTDGMVPPANAQIAPVDSDSFPSLPNAQSAYADTFAGLQTITNGAVRIDMTMIAILDGAGELLDGMNQLADGSQELADGLVQAADGSRELADGTGQASSGSRELADGTGQASSGSRELADGTGQAAAGSRELADGTGQAAAGSRELADGLGLLHDGTGQLAGGTSQIADGNAGLLAGLKLLKSGFNGGIDLLSGGMGLVIAGVGAADEPDTLLFGLNGVRLGMEQQVHPGIVGLIDALQDGTDVPLGGGVEINTSVKELIQAVNTDSPDSRLDIALGILGSTTNWSPGDDPGTVLEGLAALRAAFSPSPTSCSDAQAIFEQFGEGAPLPVIMRVISCGIDHDDPDVDDDLLGGLQQIADGLEQLRAEVNAGLGDEDSDPQETLIGGAAALAEGAKQLDEGAQELRDGAGEAAEGGGALAAGLGEIDDGANRLSSGLGEIDDGANQLSDGLAQIDTGANQLADGLGDAKDGSGRLAEGMGDARDGGERLIDAMDELQEFGTNRILNDVSRAGLDPDRLLKQARAADDRAKAGDGLPYGTTEDANASAIYQFEIAGVGTEEGLSTPARAGAAVLAFGAVGALGLGVRRFLI